MSRRTSTVLAALGSAVLSVVLLAGCAAGGAPETPKPGSTAPATDVEVTAAWVDGGDMIALLLPGSSTCVPMADEVSYDDGVLSVSLLEPTANAACTRDLVLRGIPVTLPDDVDSSADLRIDVASSGYTGSTELAGVDGLVPAGGLDAAAPSAGWTGDPGVMALLTWGSSTCLPRVEDAVVADGGEIAVQLKTPPVDQVCTADMTARVTVIEVPGVEASAYTAVVSGDGYEDVRVTIAGTPAA